MPETEFGSDGQIHDTDRPLAVLASTEHTIDPPEAESAPVTAKTKLRAFEDETFGKEAGRINGHVERGVGSPYARMTDAQKRQYAALERMVEAEKKLADASADLAKAESEHEAAVKRVDVSQKAASEPDPSKFGG
jgi:hypothetical protein